MVIEFSGYVIEFSGMVIKFSGMVIEFIGMVIISLFHTHSYILSYRKKGSAKSNHLQILYHTLQKTSSQAKPRVLERIKDSLALKI